MINFFPFKDSYDSDPMPALSGSAPIARRGDYMPVNVLDIEAPSTVRTLEGNNGSSCPGLRQLLSRRWRRLIEEGSA